MITDPLFYLLAIPAILLAGISKGGFGGGLGVLAVPLMALAIDPIVAAAIMLPILCSMDLMGIKKYWKQWDKQQILLLVPAAIVGIFIGYLSFNYLESSYVRLMVGVVAIGFALHYWFKQHLQPKSTNTWAGRFWGSIAGFTSFVSHAGGPPVNIYLLPLKLPKIRYQATTVLFFTLINYIKLLPYALVGQFSSENLTTSFLLLPLAFLGMKLGFYLHHRVSESLFYRLTYILLFITGCKLLWDGVSTLAPNTIS